MNGRYHRPGPGEQPALPAAGQGEESERRSGIVDQHEVQERQHRYDAVQVRERPRLGELVQARDPRPQP